MYKLKQAIYCLKASSDFHNEMCEECNFPYDEEVGNE